MKHILLICNNDGGMALIEFDIRKDAEEVIAKIVMERNIRYGLIFRKRTEEEYLHEVRTKSPIPTF